MSSHVLVYGQMPHAYSILLIGRTIESTAVVRTKSETWAISGQWAEV